MDISLASVRAQLRALGQDNVPDEVIMSFLDDLSGADPALGAPVAAVANDEPFAPHAQELSKIGRADEASGSFDGSLEEEADFVRVEELPSAPTLADASATAAQSAPLSFGVFGDAARELEAALEPVAHQQPAATSAAADGWGSYAPGADESDSADDKDDLVARLMAFGGDDVDLSLSRDGPADLSADVAASPATTGPPLAVTSVTHTYWPAGGADELTIEGDEGDAENDAPHACPDDGYGYGEGDDDEGDDDDDHGGDDDGDNGDDGDDDAALFAAAAERRFVAEPVVASPSAFPAPPRYGAPPTRPPLAEIAQPRASLCPIPVPAPPKASAAVAAAAWTHAWTHGQALPSPPTPPVAPAAPPAWTAAAAEARLADLCRQVEEAAVLRAYHDDTKHTPPRGASPARKLSSPGPGITPVPRPAFDARCAPLARGRPLSARASPMLPPPSPAASLLALGSPRRRPASAFGTGVSALNGGRSPGSVAASLTPSSVMARAPLVNGGLGSPAPPGHLSDRVARYSATSRVWGRDAFLSAATKPPKRAGGINYAVAFAALHAAAARELKAAKARNRPAAAAGPAFVAPHEKRRDVLRWATRSRLATHDA